MTSAELSKLIEMGKAFAATLAEGTRSDLEMLEQRAIGGADLGTHDWKAACYELAGKCRLELDCWIE